MDIKQPSTEEELKSKQGAKVQDPLPENLSEALIDVFRPIIQELDVVVEETRFDFSYPRR